MRTYKTEGIIIKRKNFGEADKILTVFTKNNGKIQIKALGVRRIISRRSPHVELLNLSLLTLYKGRNLSILTEAQTLADFSLIKSELIKVGFAYHICELIDGLCPENQENRTVFFLLRNTLEALSKESDLVSIIHGFEVELLTVLGFWPKARFLKYPNTQDFIENILERRLKSKQLIPRLI